MVAGSTCRTLATNLRDVIGASAARIRRQCRGSRGREAHPAATPFNRLKEWVESFAGKLNRLEIRDPGFDPPWRTPPDVQIANSKEEATERHTYNSCALPLRLYSDGSGQNDRISAAAVGPAHHLTRLLGTSRDAQVFHGELSGINLALDLLLSCTSLSADLPFTIFSDSQASLQFLQQGDPSHSQALSASINRALEALALRGASVKLRWLPGHKGIAGNKCADSYTDLAAHLVSLY